MPYVITCGDEGVQINEGTRIAVVGAGIKLDGFSHIVKGLKKVLGEDLRIVASAENDWTKQVLELNTFEQADASMQQYAEAEADKEGLLYSGFLPFADPLELEHDIKGHMVRPKGIHIANKICFTLAGGEQVYNLGQYLISADWVSEVDYKTADKLIKTQVEFYEKLAGEKLEYIFEEEGPLGEVIAEKNKKLVQKVLGI